MKTIIGNPSFLEPNLSIFGGQEERGTWASSDYLEPDLSIFGGDGDEGRIEFGEEVEMEGDGVYVKEVFTG